MLPVITSDVPNREIVAMFIECFLVSGLLGFRKRSSVIEEDAADPRHDRRRPCES